MATAMERAAIGSEEARMEGRGPGGRAAEAARNVATGRDQPGFDRYNDGVGHTGAGPFNTSGTDVRDRGLLDGRRDHHHDGLIGDHHHDGLIGDHHHDGVIGGHHHNGVIGGHHHNGLLGGGHHGPLSGGGLGHTEEEMARLRSKTHITAEGEAYCPNPNLRDLPKEFETRVQVIQRYPEMKTVEKTDFVKEVHHEERTIIVQRSRVIHDDIERIDRVPVVRQVPKTRIEIHYKTVQEEREVIDMVQEVDYVDVPRIEMVPRVITEDVEERVIVPVVREVPVTRMVEVPTGNYCEAPAGSFVSPGDFNLLHHKGAGLGGLLHRSKSGSSSSSSSSSSSDDEGHVAHDGTTTGLEPNVNGTVAPRRRKKKSLLRRVLHQ